MHKNVARASLFLSLLALPPITFCQVKETFAERLRAIMSRPEYKNSQFGVEIYSLDEKRTLFRLHGDLLFKSASTTKLLTEGTALGLLGPDYRFRTTVYRTGSVDQNGILRGDLILVASGDPNLSNRVQSDDTLSFENEDHAYSGRPTTKAVPGDPLKIIRKLADQIAAKGIREIRGRARVDAALFPEGNPLEDEDGISPIIINDNLIDILVTPSDSIGETALLRISPRTAYLRFENGINTAAIGVPAHFSACSAAASLDGTYTVALVGSIPRDSPSISLSCPVPNPTRFAEAVLLQALKDKGISVEQTVLPATDDAKGDIQYYRPENLVAEHVSPPLSEEIKVTLKVSQNLHAAVMPRTLGALLRNTRANAEQTGFDIEREFLQKAGLDLNGASQADGPGGQAYFTPDFMVHYLAFVANQKYYQVFLHALPILGRDGTLAEIQKNSPAAGHVFAKTGTTKMPDLLNRRTLLTAKGLSGYMASPHNGNIAFAFYVNNVPLPANVSDADQKLAGEALGEIATATYELAIDRQTIDSE